MGLLVILYTVRTASSASLMRRYSSALPGCCQGIRLQSAGGDTRQLLLYQQYLTDSIAHSISTPAVQ